MSAIPTHPPTWVAAPVTQPTSLRDYFAGQALVGLLASDRGPRLKRAEIASNAYLFADFMLAEREKE